MSCLITIGGTSYSGSTLLDLMLGNAACAFSCGEIYAKFRPTRVGHLQPRCPCGMVPCPVWDQLRDVPEHRFHLEVARRLGVEFVIDSSKDLCWLADTQGWARRSGLRVVNLVIWKDPQWHGYSYWKRGKPVENAPHAFLKYYRRLIALNVPFTTISYNRLAADAQGELREVCRVTGLPYFPGKERFWEKQHHYLFGNPGIPEQLRSKHGRIRADSLPAEYVGAFRISAEKLRGELDDVVSRLQRVDVRRQDRAAVQSIRWRPRIMPFWYYRHRLNNLYLRHFPRPARSFHQQQSG